MEITFIIEADAVLKNIIPLIAVILAFLLGKWAYFRQKEYELITKRYLEEGLDTISKNVDSSLSIIRHNWNYCLNTLKSFRDMGKDMHPALYKEGLVEPEPSNFELWRNYRLTDVVGDDIFHDALQLLDSFVKTSHSFFKYDLCNGIRVTVEGGEEVKVIASREKIYKEMLKKVVNIDENAIKFYVLLGELQNITNIIQTKRFCFKSMKKIRRNPKVIKSVSILKDTFKDKLDETEETLEQTQ